MEKPGEYAYNIQFSRPPLHNGADAPACTLTQAASIGVWAVTGNLVFRSTLRNRTLVLP